MQIPIILTNFKTYDKDALELARIHEQVAKETNFGIAIATQACDIYKISQNVKIPVFAQHIDPITAGANTGKVLAESAKKAGASGTLLNHSENRISFDIIEKSVKRAKEAGLTVIVCAENVDEVRKISELQPDFIAIEPKELIGGDISVSTANPEIISNSVKASKVPVLAGAGIKSGKDVKKALELGAKGILVASGVVKAADVKATLLDLVRGAKND